MNNLKVSKRVALRIDEFAHIIGTGYKYQMRRHNKAPVIGVDIADWGPELNFHVTLKNPETDEQFGLNFLIPRESFSDGENE